MPEKRVPKIGEGVWVQGRQGRFVVVRVDKQASAADLRSTTSGRTITAVPFTMIRPMEDDVDQPAAQRI